MLGLSAAGLGIGFASQVEARFEAIPRVAELTGVLTPLDDASVVENYLLVGSDSRAGADPNDPDFGSIGDEASTSGRRSDTIMVLRYDRQVGSVSMLSLPRDLWVDIDGERGSDRINSAYNDGPATLVQTVQQNLGLPVHHYLEVNFQGFKDIVDAIGGVDICFMTEARDLNTGLLIDSTGCQRLDGVQSLQYARSRYYESYVDGEWQIDGTADIGRMARQQMFLNAALAQAVASTSANPFRISGVVDSSVASLLIDPSLDVMAMAAQLRPAASGNLTPYSLPVRGVDKRGKAVLEMINEQALPLLAYFQGGAPAPV